MRSTKLTFSAAATLTAAMALTACATDETTGGSGSDGEALEIGWLLPQTGPIASLGPPQIAALELAAEDINDAGGVLGSPISYVGADEAGDPSVAGQSVDRLLADGVAGIVGAGSSSITLSVIDKITGSGVVQCSGMNTTPELTGYPDDDYYFRTVPSDVLQGGVLGDLIAADGGSRVAIVARNDAYATGIADTTEQKVRDLGLEVVARVDYDPSAQDLSAEVRQVVADDPDAIVVFAFDEGAKLLQGLIQQGYGPGAVKVYGTDALPVAALPEMVSPGNLASLTGMKLTQASSGADSPFTERLLEFEPGLGTTAFTPYFYDCATMIALAAEKAGSVDSTQIRDQMIDVTSGDQECSTYADCLALIEDGQEIAYVGAAGPLAFDDQGEPTTGLYDVLQYDEAGTTTTLDTVRAELG